MPEVLPVPSVQPLQQQAVEGSFTGPTSVRTAQQATPQGLGKPGPAAVQKPDSDATSPALLRTHVAFTVDHETGDMYIRVIDNETREVIRQIPPEEFVRIANRLAKMIGILFDQRS
jgi:flagellar protein FlaG